jgi:UDP-glucose 4-epimerase
MHALLKARSVEAVVHFAGNAYVGESMKSPDKYFQNITVGTLQLLQAMDAAGVPNLIFSSSCATFGEPASPITEATPQRPTNPYGLSKLHAEQSILEKARVRQRQGQPFSVASLRYFNVIGADPSGRLGPVLTHQEQWDYPRIVDAAIDAALGLRPKLTVMGDKFSTEDGTAVRDYIHVTDLVAAHLDALLRLEGLPLVYNVGVGKGYTVKKVVKVVEKVRGGQGGGGGGMSGWVGVGRWGWHGWLSVFEHLHTASPFSHTHSLPPTPPHPHRSQAAPSHSNSAPPAPVTQLSFTPTRPRSSSSSAGSRATPTSRRG